jgi:AcrR family transcriptional regulator
MGLQAAKTSRDARRQAIIDVAREVFLHEGYAATSMSTIAARVGGSKGTLYNYFPSKECLFSALMEAENEGHPWASAAIDPGGRDLPAVLADIGARFLDFIMSDRVQELHRLVIAECERFPELGRTFYDNGPRQGVALVAGLMEREMAAGRLIRKDPEMTAMVFLELCKSGIHQKRLWNIETHISPERKAANVEEAVRVFLAAYAAERLTS